MENITNHNEPGDDSIVLDSNHNVIPYTFWSLRVHQEPVGLFTAELDRYVMLVCTIHHLTIGKHRCLSVEVDGYLW